MVASLAAGISSVNGCDASSPILVFYAAALSSILRDHEAQKQSASERERDERTEYDYIVVGGGAAGSVLAARLSEDPATKVLLLEKGGHEAPEARVPGLMINNIGSAMAELYKAVPEPQNCNGTGCLLNVAAVLGGGSTINGMVFVRGSDVDFDTWANLTGDERWSYRNVLPYFKKSEDNLDFAVNWDRRFHGHGGPQKVSWESYRHPAMTPLAAALNKLGLPYRRDVNGRAQLGQTIAQSTQVDGERWSTYRSYLEPVVAERSNLRVETFAIARKVLLEETVAGLQAVGVKYENAGGQVIEVRASKEVIVSAGALNSPQLLLLSGIGPSQHLKTLGVPVVADLPVGEGLEDHTGVLGIRYKCGPPLCAFDWETRQEDLRQYKSSREGALAATNMMQLMAFFRSKLAKPGTGHQPDLQLLFFGTTQTEEIGPLCLAGDSWRVNRVIVGVSLLRPESKGWVRLNASDPHGTPLVNLNFFGDDQGHDLATTVEGLRVAVRMEEPLRNTGLTLDTTSNPQCADFPMGSDDFLRCVARTTTTTAWHWTGTCRMGRDDDSSAVVDSQLRVRGVRGLRVADASVMPTIPSGNTFAATIMVAEVAADLIRRGE